MENERQEVRAKIWKPGVLPFAILIFLVLVQTARGLWTLSRIPSGALTTEHVFDFLVSTAILVLLFVTIGIVIRNYKPSPRPSWNLREEISEEGHEAQVKRRERLLDQTLIVLIVIGSIVAVALILISLLS